MKRKIITFVMMLIVVIPSVFLFSGCDLFDFGSNSNYSNNSSNSGSNNNSNNTTNNNSGNGTNIRTKVNVECIDEASHWYRNNYDLHVGEFTYEYDTWFSESKGQYVVYIRFKIIYTFWFYNYDRFNEQGRIGIYKNDVLEAISDIFTFRSSYLDASQYETARVSVYCYYDDSLPASINYVAKLVRL